MGKKRFEKIARLDNHYQRKVTQCKRKRGVLKKIIELSVLCDLKIFMLIKDEGSNRTTHFLSHKHLNIMDLFNGRSHREFYTNSDYVKVGGNFDDLDSQLKLSEQNSEMSSSSECADKGNQIVQSNSKEVKLFSNKRHHLLRTSRIGNYWQQKKSLPQSTEQAVIVQEIEQETVSDHDFLSEE